MVETEKKDLIQEILELKKKIFALKMEKSDTDVKDTSKIKKLRKEIARLFTKLNMRG